MGKEVKIHRRLKEERGEGFGLPWGGDVPAQPSLGCHREIPEPKGLEVPSGLSGPRWVLLLSKFITIPKGWNCPWGSQDLAGGWCLADFGSQRARIALGARQIPNSKGPELRSGLSGPHWGLSTGQIPSPKRLEMPSRLSGPHWELLLGRFQIPKDWNCPQDSQDLTWGSVLGKFPIPKGWNCLRGSQDPGVGVQTPGEFIPHQSQGALADRGCCAIKENEIEAF